MGGNHTFYHFVNSEHPWADKENLEPPGRQEITHFEFDKCRQKKGGKMQDHLASQCNLLLIMPTLQ